MKRLTVIDALRGFAVVAIMLLHFIEHFIYGVYPPATTADTATWDVLFFLFAGKSYTIFALLFGFTYAIQYQNQIAKGGDFTWRFAWRLLILAGFASINAIFFPGGDVLMLFALMGFVMILARKLAIKWLLVIACLFLVQPVEIYYTIRTILDPLFVQPKLLADAVYPALKTAVDSGSFITMASANIYSGQVASLAWAADVGRFLQAPGLFLVGMVIFRAGLFTKKEVWGKIFVCSFLASFALYILKSSADIVHLSTIFTMWYNVAFTGVIIAAFVMLYNYDWFAGKVSGLTFYGRMSLTNYVSQSFIGSLIFFPYALNLAPVLGIAASFLVGLIVMWLQIIFSKYWFAHHKLGPLESLWHKITWIKI